MGVTTKRLLGEAGLDKQSMGLVGSPDSDGHIILNSKCSVSRHVTSCTGSGTRVLIDCALSLVVKLYV